MWHPTAWHPQKQHQLCGSAGAPIFVGLGSPVWRYECHGCNANFSEFPKLSIPLITTIIVDRSAIWDHIDFLGSPRSVLRRCLGNNGSQDGLLDGRRFQRYATQRLHCTMSGALQSTARGTRTPRHALITK